MEPYQRRDLPPPLGLALLRIMMKITSFRLTLNGKKTKGTFSLENSLIALSIHQMEALRVGAEELRLTLVRATRILILRIVL
jgi:hypothetical protein